MPQCLQIQPDGTRCPHPAEIDYPFCHWHLREMQAAEEPGSQLRRAVLRLAALLLLLAFLLPLTIQGYRLLKALFN